MRRFSRRRSLPLLLSCAGLACIAAVGAHARQDVLKTEAAVRKAAFDFFSSFVFCDADRVIDGAVYPMVSLRNGKATIRDEKSMRELIESVAARTGVRGLPAEDRKRIAENMLRVFDSAEIRFLGGNTATVVFVVRPKSKPDEGDYLGELILYKRADRWRVMVEVTDSTPAPKIPELEPTPPTAEDP